MGISFEHYRIFYNVAKYGGFTQAANAIKSNQPNITRTVKNLERELGCQLFVRSNRGVTMTPEGEKLYRHVRIAVEQIEAGEEELSSERSLQNGVILIGATEVALRCCLLPVLKKYHEAYPGVKLKLFNYTTPQAIDALKSGSIDIAVVTTPMGELRSLTSSVITGFRDVPVCGENYQSYFKSAVSFEELADYPIISLGEQTKHYEFYRDLFVRHGLEFNPDIEAATADQILPLVRNNLGVGFVPQEFLKNEASGVYEIKLKEKIPSRSVCLVKRADAALGVAVKEFEEMLHSYGK